MLGSSVDGPVLVDNDVNWEARAERAAVPPGELADFAYLHLGEGMGCAVVSDGEVRRGFTGIAGEVAHLVTVGPGGRAMLLTEVFQELGLRQAGTTAIDVAVLLDAFDGRDAVTGPVRAAVGTALSGVLAALVAVCDPEVVILGGEWGGHPAVIDTVSCPVPAITPPRAHPPGRGDRGARAVRRAPPGRPAMCPSVRPR